MEVTEQNKTLIKAFLGVLRITVKNQASRVAITALLQTKEQMDELVMFIQNNPEATEMETLERAKQIVNE